MDVASTTNAGKPLSVAEIKLIADFLQDYADECADHTCNDFFCPATRIALLPSVAGQKKSLQV